MPQGSNRKKSLKNLEFKIKDENNENDKIFKRVFEEDLGKKSSYDKNQIFEIPDFLKKEEILEPDCIFMVVGG